MIKKSRMCNAALVCLMLLPVTGRTLASSHPVGEGANPGARQTDAAKLVDILTERGMAKEDAQAVTNELSADDIQVLGENPEMLQAVGDANDTEAAVLIVLLIIILLAAAAIA